MVFNTDALIDPLVQSGALNVLRKRGNLKSVEKHERLDRYK